MILVPNKHYAKVIRGKVGEGIYARRSVYNKDEMIVQSNPDRTLKPGQQKHQEVVRTNNAMLLAKEEAKRIYHDSVLCQPFKDKFNLLCSKIRGKSRFVNGRYVPHTLWLFIYAFCLKNANKHSH